MPSCKNTQLDMPPRQSQTRMKIRSPRRWLSLMALGGVLPLLAQLNWIKGFKGLEYYDQQELPSGSTSQLKSYWLAKEALPQRDGTAIVKQLHIETYQPDGQTNFIVQAPDCTLDNHRRTASSPSRLEVRSGDDRFQISGDGFFCQLTNTYVRLSNNVVAHIRKDAREFKSANP